tara:strand:- start:3591 stop:4319 length:729 start_codon:yes stop_codon:yes gene_type:complete
MDVVSFVNHIRSIKYNKPIIKKKEEKIDKNDKNDKKTFLKIALAKPKEEPKEEPKEKIDEPDDNEVLNNLLEKRGEMIDDDKNKIKKEIMENFEKQRVVIKKIYLVYNYHKYQNTLSGIKMEDVFNKYKLLESLIEDFKKYYNMEIKIHNYKENDRIVYIKRLATSYSTMMSSPTPINSLTTTPTNTSKTNTPVATTSKTTTPISPLRIKSPIRFIKREVIHDPELMLDDDDLDQFDNEDWE